METEDGNESPKPSVFRDLLSLKNCTVNNVNSRESPTNGGSSPSQEKNSEKNFFGPVQSAMDNSLPVSIILIVLWGKTYLTYFLSFMI